jgi:hypothetical protein
VLDPVDPNDSDLLERPARDPLGKLAVPRLDALPVDRLDLGVEPGVAEQLGRTDDGEARRVARLHGADEAELPARGKEVGRVENLALLGRVVAVCGSGSPQDGRQQRAGAEDLADTPGEGNQVGCLGLGVEVILEPCAELRRRREEEDVVLVCGAGGIVVEVVDDETRSVGGNADVELGQEADDRGRDRGGRGEGEEDVALRVDELEEDIRGQVGAEACPYVSQFVPREEAYRKHRTTHP